MEIHKLQRLSAVELPQIRRSAHGFHGTDNDNQIKRFVIKGVFSQQQENVPC